MTDPTASPTDAPPTSSPATQSRPRQRLVVGGAGLGAIAVVVVIIVVVSGGSTAPSGFTNANPGQSTKVAGMNATALSQISAYKVKAQNCKANIVCLETANRKLGDQIHLYANYVGSLSQKGAAGKVVANTLNVSQVTANTLEILGDAQPTKANYDLVLHHFDLAGQIDKLTSAINSLAGAANG
jgi:hypothetical protein